jgi:hypothetical protein
MSDTTLKARPKQRVRRTLLLGLALLLFSLGAYLSYGRGRPAPVPVKHTYYDGAVTYHRRVYYLPHLVIAHVLTVDTRAKGLHLLITPPDNAEGAPLNARTTSQFLSEFGMQFAVNGDGFSPWWSHGPLDYYPHPGDPVTPNGFAASNGVIYGEGEEPILYIGRRNTLSFRKPGRVFNAIAGDRYLLLGGELVDGLDDSERDPRTAIGLSKNGRWLYLVVVDGRQPFYSAGATFLELARILKAHGAHYGMSLDGGGSSTMAMVKEGGQPELLNSPIDQHLPGRERPVANHIGIYFNR